MYSWWHFVLSPAILTPCVYSVYTLQFLPHLQDKKWSRTLIFQLERPFMESGGKSALQNLHEKSVQYSKLVSKTPIEKCYFEIFGKSALQHLIK